MMMPLAEPFFSALRQALTQRLFGDFGDCYARLNAARDWFNGQVPGFEWYLEDVWDEYAEGQTWIEHRVRSLYTRDETEVLGVDIYANHRDAKGVWHLDDYQDSRIWVTDVEAVVQFVATNGPTTHHHSSLPPQAGAPQTT